MCWTLAGLAVKTWLWPSGRRRVKVKLGKVVTISHVHSARRCMFALMAKYEPIKGYDLGSLPGLDEKKVVRVVFRKKQSRGMRQRRSEVENARSRTIVVDGKMVSMDTLSVQVTETEISLALTRLANMLMAVQLLVLAVLNLYGKL